MDFIYPLIAIGLVFSTLTSRYQTINLVLAILLLFHFGYEEYIIRGDHYDSIQHDIYMLGIYSLACGVFYLLKAKFQTCLAGVGALMSVIYGTGWFFVAYPHDYFYKEFMVILTITQLLIAGRGAIWALFNYLTRRVRNDRRTNRSGYNGAEHRSMPSGRP